MKKIVLIGILMLCSGSLVFGGLTQWSVEDGGNGHFYRSYSGIFGVDVGPGKSGCPERRWLPGYDHI